MSKNKNENLQRYDLSALGEISRLEVLLRQKNLIQLLSFNLSHHMVVARLYIGDKVGKYSSNNVCLMNEANQSEVEVGKFLYAQGSDIFSVTRFPTNTGSLKLLGWIMSIKKISL